MMRFFSLQTGPLLFQLAFCETQGFVSCLRHQIIAWISESRYGGNILLRAFVAMATLDAILVSSGPYDLKVDVEEYAEYMYNYCRRQVDISV